MGHKIFVNLPVTDLRKSMAFWNELGFKFNAQFSDDSAACLIFSDEIYAMLHTPASLARFTQKKIVDTSTSIEVILALSADSKEEVNRICDAALKAGSTETRKPEDYGFMYQRSFYDLDGHSWELIYMDPSNVQAA